jgi:microcystin-dependent protein
MSINGTNVEQEFTNVIVNVAVNVNIQVSGSTSEVLVRYGNLKLIASEGPDYSVVIQPNRLTFYVTPFQALLDKIAANGPNVLYISRNLPLTSDFDYDNAFVRQKIVDEFDRVWMVEQQNLFKIGSLEDANEAAHEAEISADAAATSAAAAQTSATNAATSEANAASSKNAAGASAAAAAASATNSANSATASQNSAVASAASAASAANSASIATNKVDKAGDTMTGPLNLPAGAINNPSLQFGTGNSGFYATGTGVTAVLKAEVNAADKLAIDINAVSPVVPLRASAGAVGSPAISFTAEPTAGFYRAGAGDIRFAMNGADVVKWLNDKSETHFGPIVLPADPTLPLQAATKQYVDNTAAALPNPTPTTKGGVKSYGPVVNQFLKAIDTSGNVTSAAIGPSDLPDPTSGTKGGVKAIAPVSGSFMTSIGTDGTPTMAPATSGPPPAPSPTILGGVFSKAPVAGQYVNGVDTAGNVLTATLTANDVLTSIKTVDGTGSGLDADLLDGLDSTAFATTASVAAKVNKAGDTMTGPLVHPLGTTAATSINFGTPGTGIWSAGATRIDFSTSGVTRFTVLDGQLVPTVPIQTSYNGTAGAPAYTFFSEQNSGWYRAAAGDVRLSMGGNDVVQFKASDKSMTTYGVHIAPSQPGTISSSSNPSAVMVQNSGAAGDAAYMTFIRQGAWAVQIGLDTDNAFKIGGWSMGAAAYRILHEGLTDSPRMVPPGTILPYAGSVAPAGFYLCNAQNISRAANPKLNALWSAVSYPFGTGDGSTTMGVPDLRARAPIGIDNMGGGATTGRISYGYTGGFSTYGMNIAGGESIHGPSQPEIPNHSHSHNHAPSGGGNFTATNPGASNSLPAGSSARLVGNTDTDATTASGSTNAYMNQFQPSLMVNYIIAGG